jgi:hypothetical protein
MTKKRLLPASHLILALRVKIDIQMDIPTLTGDIEK